MDPGDSYKRRVIRRKDCIALREERVAPAPLPLLPPVSSQRLHKTRVNGSAITSPTPFSKRPPVERARDREKEGVGEREREARYRRRNEACIQMERFSLSLSLCVEIKSKRGVGSARVAAEQIFSDSSQIVSPPGRGCSVCTPPPDWREGGEERRDLSDGIYRLFRVD